MILILLANNSFISYGVNRVIVHQHYAEEGDASFGCVVLLYYKGVMTEEKYNAKKDNNKGSESYQNGKRVK